MNRSALVLSALGVDAEHGASALAALRATLADRGYDVEVVDCRTVDVIPCTGCSSCGLRTPGTCVVKDDMQGVFRKLVASDVLVLATPLRFGSYCAELKKVVDRFQPLMVPIDGRPLGEAGMFSWQLRKVLPLAVADIAAARHFSPETIARSDRSPLPMPARMMIALMNSRTRRAARSGTLDLEAQVYATDASREK